MQRYSHISEIIHAAQSAKCTIAVAFAQDSVVLEAVNECRSLGIADSILIGKRAEIEEAGKSLGISLEGYRFKEAATAKEASVEAVECVARGEADILVKGHLETSVLLKAAFDRSRGIKSDTRASHVSVVEVPNYSKLLIISDAAVNITPDFAIKCAIVKNAVNIAHVLGIEKPKVAILSAIETVNENMASTMDAAIISKMGERGQLGNCFVDGPLSFDLAVSKASTQHKKIKSEVAGDADILILPGIESGNILYKALVHFARALAAQIVTGTIAPIVVTSRSDSAQTRVASIALAALVARMETH